MIIYSDHIFSRINVSRNARRQMRFGDQKVITAHHHGQHDHHNHHHHLEYDVDHHHDHHHAQVILVKGHFYSDLPLCSRDEPVFVAHCSPLAMPENREIVVQVSLKMIMVKTTIMMTET